MIRPSCPALVVLDDDPFRKTLVASLDQKNFMVSFSEDGNGVRQLLDEKKFSVVIVGLNLSTQQGVNTLKVIKESREKLGCGVIILGDPHPDIRSYAPWADELFLKPVDPSFVTTRALAYCNCES